MTEREYDLEWQYLYEERLGLLCGNATPTVEQTKQAHDYATSEVNKLKEMQG